MRSQLSSLTNRLEQNRELLKSNLIISLTGGTIRTEAVLERRMGLLGLKLKGRRFFALCISLDDVLTEAPNAQEVELMKLAICQQIEALTDESALYIACETRTDELTAICFLQEPDKEVSLEGLGLELLMQYQGHVCLGIGCYVDSPLKLRASYTNAQENLKYRYFHPDWLYYSDVNASNRLMPENDVLKEHAQAFAQALQEKDIERAIDEVHLFSYSAQDTVYPFAAAQERLEMLTQAMRHFSSGISEPHRLICESFLKSAANAKGLREYCYQLCVALRSLAAPASARPTVSQKNAALVDTIRQYIALNLPGDLSLTQLEVFRLSGSYLSRIFKEAMGISILDYITSERLERASQLLVQTDQSVESIAARSGLPHAPLFQPPLSGTLWAHAQRLPAPARPRNPYPAGRRTRLKQICKKRIQAQARHAGTHHHINGICLPFAQHKEARRKKEYGDAVGVGETDCSSIVVFQKARTAMVTPAEAIRAMIAGRSPLRMPLSRSISLYLRYRRARISTMMHEGSTQPMVATMAPANPAMRMPTNVAELMAMGPGVIWEMEMMSANSVRS